MTTNGNFNVNNINTVKVPTINTSTGNSFVPAGNSNYIGVIVTSNNIYYLDTSTGFFYVAPTKDPANAVLHNSVQVTSFGFNIFPTLIGDFYYGYESDIDAAGPIFAAHKDTPLSWYNTGVGIAGVINPMIYYDGTNIYALGGNDSTFTIDTIEVAAVGSPTTFSSSGTTLPAPRESAPVVAIGSNIYMYGGADSGNSQSTIYTATTAAPTIWSDTGDALPRPIDSSAVYVDANFVYIFGGTDSSGAVDISDIYTAPIATPTVFTLNGASLPNTLSHQKLFVAGDFIYMVGVSTGGGTGFIRAAVSDPLTWTELKSTGVLATAEASTHIAIQGSKVYAFGGFNSAGAASTVIQSAPTAHPLEWTNESDVLPAGLYGGQLIKTKSYLYIIGGNGVTGNYYRAPLATPTVWTLVDATGPTKRYGQAVIIDDQVLYFGGEIAGPTASTTGWRALVVNGEILHWEQLFSLPVGLSRFSLIQAGDYIYAIGGFTGAVATINTTIYRTQINDLANWVNIGTLNTGIHSPAVAIINNQVYLIGGTTATDLTSSDDYVLRADMTDLANGSAIFVEENTAIPGTLAASKATCVNDDLYLVGGRTGTVGTVTLYRNLHWATHNLVLPKVPESSASLPTLDLKTGTLGSYSSFHRTGFLPWLVTDK